VEDIIKHVTMGTAGHIDHGKTALVKKLTGTDTDRLAEEKARGMTIDLGFAFLPLPSGNTVSIVDVPGHEKFVKTMVAGVTGIDFVMLVVASDEGIMPQTQEHIDILSILGVDSGLVALTKADLVTRKEIEQRKLEVNEALQETTLKNLDIIPVSSLTGEGVDTIIQKIDQLTLTTKERSYQQVFRLPVDRVFTMTGHGTVVTGTIAGGRIQKGQTVDLLPQGLTSKVRNIQVRNQSVEEGVAGDRCALNLTGIEKEDIQRGTVVTEKGKVSAQSLLDAFVHMAPGEEPLVHNQRVHFHTGTSSVIARIRILGKEEIQRGNRGYAQLRLEEPVVALRGDRFILRSYSPVRTIGGGMVLLHATQHRKRWDQKALDIMGMLEPGKEEELVQSLFQQAKGPVTISELKEKILVPEENLSLLLDAMQQEGNILFLESAKSYVSRRWYDESYASIEKQVGVYLNKYPYRYRIPREELKSRVFPKLSSKGVSDLLKHMEMESKLMVHGNQIGVKEKERVQEILERKDVGLVQEVFSKESFVVLSIHSLLEEVSLDIVLMEEIIRFLLKQKIIVEIGDGQYTNPEALKMAYEKMRNYLDSNPAISAAQLRDLLETGRKIAILYLEYFDEKQITIRQGNDRVKGPRYDELEEGAVI